MGCVLYPGKEPETASWVMSSLRQRKWGSPLEICLSFDRLIERLLQIPIDCDAVVAVTDLHELKRLGGTWKCLLPPKLILVLEEWESRTLKTAATLSPSYLALLGDGLADVCLVLERIESNRVNRVNAATSKARSNKSTSR